VRLPLNARIVADLALPAGKGEEFFWDTGLAGFGVRLRRSPGGVRRTYVAQCHVDGRTRRETVGPADRLTYSQAREAARLLLARVTLGHDPQQEREERRARAALTFRRAAEAYLDARRGELRPASTKAAALYLVGDAFKPLHARPLGEVTRADVAARVAVVARERGTATAAAARRALSAMYAWAVASGWAEGNPVIGTLAPAQGPAGEHVCSDAELVAIWRAVDGESDFGRCVRLLILLGSRRSEVGGMRWSEIDLAAGTWTLPAARSKNKRSLTLALPPAALDVIRSVPRHGLDHLFGPAGFTNWERSKAALDCALGTAVRPFRLHDIRRSVATRVADLGVEPHVIEAILNHHGGHRRGVAGIYNRSVYERQAKAALARWSEHVLALVEERAPDDRVVPLRA
jgi:integrase